MATFDRERFEKTTENLSPRRGGVSRWLRVIVAALAFSSSPSGNLNAVPSHGAGGDYSYSVNDDEDSSEEEEDPSPLEELDIKISETLDALLRRARDCVEKKELEPDAKKTLPEIREKYLAIQRAYDKFKGLLYGPSELIDKPDTADSKEKPEAGEGEAGGMDAESEKEVLRLGEEILNGLEELGNYPHMSEILKHVLPHLPKKGCVS